MLRRRFLPPLMALPLLAALPASPAASQPAPAATAAPAAPDADTLYREALEHGKAKDWPKMYQKLAHAFHLKKSFDIATNLGAAEFNLGKYVDAAEHVRYGLSIFPPKEKPEHKKNAEDVLARAKAQIGILRVRVTPADAEVRVNDRKLGEEANREEVFVEAGEVRVEAAARGYESFSRTVKIEKGGTGEVAVAMKAAASGPTATATATGAPSAVPTATATGGPSVPLLVTGIGLTAVTLGLGIGLLVGEAEKKREADGLREDLLKSGIDVCEPGSPPADCQRFRDTGLGGAAMGNAGAGLLIASGVVAASTILYAVVTRPRKGPASPVQVGFGIGPSGASAVFSGNF